MSLKNTIRVLVATTAAAFAFGAANIALGTQTQHDFYDCLEPTNGSSAARQKCCTYAGGAWVEIYDENGDVKDAFCDGAEAGVEEEEVRTTRTYTTNGTYTSSGTYQQTATPAPSKTATTTATYQQQPTSSSGSTTTSRTSTTTATYSR